MNSFNFSRWATPVKHRGWAIVAVLLHAVKAASGYRLFRHSSHRAWERAVGMMAIAFIAILVGCQAVTSGPSTQPTVAGIASAVALEQGFTATVQIIDNAYRAKLITPAQFKATALAVKQAKADVDAAEAAAMSGASGAAGLAAIATADLTILADATPTIQPTTKP